MIAGAGEALLYLVLIPYYLTALLHYLIGEKAMPAAYCMVIVLVIIGCKQYFRSRIAAIAIPVGLIMLPYFVDFDSKLACFNSIEQQL